MISVQQKRSGHLKGPKQPFEIETISSSVPFHYSPDVMMDRATTTAVRHGSSLLAGQCRTGRDLETLAAPPKEFGVDKSQNVTPEGHMVFGQDTESARLAISVIGGGEDNLQPREESQIKEENTERIATSLAKHLTHNASRLRDVDKKNRSSYPPHIQVKLFRPKSSDSGESDPQPLYININNNNDNNSNNNVGDTKVKDKGMMKEYPSSTTTTLSTETATSKSQKSAKKLKKVSDRSLPVPDTSAKVYSKPASSGNSRKVEQVSNRRLRFPISEDIAEECDASVNSHKSAPSPEAGLKRLFGRKKTTGPYITSPEGRVTNPKVTFDLDTECDDTATSSQLKQKQRQSVVADVERSSTETDNNKILRLISSEGVSSNLEVYGSSIEDNTTIFEDETALIQRLRGVAFKPGQQCIFVNKFTTSLQPDECGAQPAVVKDATDVHPLSNGETVVTDMLSSKLVVFDARGFPRISMMLERGSEPWSSCVTPEDTLAVSMAGKGCVNLWMLSGEPMAEFGQDVLVAPHGIAYHHPTGRLVVTDGHNHAVYLYDTDGRYVGELIGQQQQEVQEQSPNSNATTAINDLSSVPEGFSLQEPRYLAVSNDGLYYCISDTGHHKIKIFNQDGDLLREIGSYGRRDGQFRFPYGVAFDNEACLVYVADHFNNRISVFSLKNGTFQHHLLTAEDGITRPKGLAVRESHLYVTYGNLRAGNIAVYRLHDS